MIRQKPWAFYLPYSLFIITLATLLIYNEKAELHLWLRSFHSPFGDLFFKYQTHWGESFPFIVAGLLLLYQYRISLFILSSGLLTGIFTFVAKRIFDAPRPRLFFAEHFPEITLRPIEGVEMYTQHSFPSGHTATAFSFFLCLALATRNKALHVLYFCMAALVGYSRIYLSQHFAEDVLAGSLVGCFSTWLCYHFIFLKYPMNWSEGSLRDIGKGKHNKKN